MIASGPVAEIPTSMRCYLSAIVRCHRGFNQTNRHGHKQKWRMEFSAVEKLVLCTVAVLHFLDGNKVATILQLSFFISAE